MKRSDTELDIQSIIHEHATYALDGELLNASELSELILDKLEESDNPLSDFTWEEEE